MEFIFKDKIVSITDDEMTEIDRIIKDHITYESIWSTIDPYGDSYISGNDLIVLIQECSIYEQLLKGSYLRTMVEIRALSELAYSSNGSLYICGD